jgi:thiopeptide-type bacteriocin biosynthesis protein
MDETQWRQVNVAYPSPDRHERERHIVTHLAGVMPAAEADALITSWWFIRKGPWRVRYLPTNSGTGDDPLHQRLTTRQGGRIAWANDIYEPEIHAFGGPASMDIAHTLFHLDSSHVLTYLNGDAQHRRERSLILCTALMRSAGLDLNEQGDVWARIAEQRAGVPDQSVQPDRHAWESFTGGVRHLILGTARVDTIETGWLAAFEAAGANLRHLRERAGLTRGIRAIIALHVIFHWNRIGLNSPTQANLARAAQEGIFGQGR